MKPGDLLKPFDRYDDDGDEPDDNFVITAYLTEDDDEYCLEINCNEILTYLCNHILPEVKNQDEYKVLCRGRIAYVSQDDVKLL
jgi:hypothetical protein